MSVWERANLSFHITETLRGALQSPALGALVQGVRLTARRTRRAELGGGALVTVGVFFWLPSGACHPRVAYIRTLALQWYLLSRYLEV